MFSAYKIIKGSPVEICEIIIDIHDYYCKSYLPFKIKEKKRLQEINSLDYDNENDIYNDNCKITNNQDNLKLLKNNNVEGKEFHNKASSRNYNNNYNFMNKIQRNANNDKNINSPLDNFNNKSGDKNQNKSKDNQRKEEKKNNQKFKKNDYYSVNSFDFNYKIIASEEELKDRM